MNEREIADGFAAVWSDCFPFLSPTFIIAFNRGLVGPIATPKGIVQPVPAIAKTSRSDVLAEYGFRLAALGHERNLGLDEVTSDGFLTQLAMAGALKRIHNFRPNQPIGELTLDDAEQKEATQLATVYQRFIELFPGETVSYSPALAGYGIVNSCAADLCVGRTLFEVKTVSRPFRSRDLRQLIVYLALQSATGSARWQFGGLLNPRLGTYCKFEISWLVGRLSGGRPPQAVFLDFLQALNRDYVRDFAF